MVGVACVLQLDAQGRVSDARLAYTSMGPRPSRAPRGERALLGEMPTSEVFARAAAAAMADLEPADDQHASRAYRVHAARALTTRVLTRARDRASGG
jgi:carbon-monoxide dehydrogenase medium subunit